MELKTSLKTLIEKLAYQKFNADQIIQKFFESPSKMAGLYFLIILLPITANFYLIIPEEFGPAVSEYYPNLYFFSVGLSKALVPLVLYVGLILISWSSEVVRYLLVIPLAFNSVKAYYIMTATSNAEYLVPPINVTAIVVAGTTIFVLLYISNKLIHKHYHGKKTSAMCSLIGLLDAESIPWNDKESVVKKLVEEIKQNRSLIYN